MCTQRQIPLVAALAVAVMWFWGDSFLFGGVVIQSAVNPANGNFYYLIAADDGTSGITWTDAEATAISLGGHLATIRDEAENNWVTSTFTHRRIWIGLNDAVEEGTFVWSSGEPVTYTRWYPGEPNNSHGVEHYVGIYNERRWSYQWNDYANKTDVSIWPDSGTIAIYGLAEVIPAVTVVPEPCGLTVWLVFTTLWVGTGLATHRHFKPRLASRQASH